MIVVEHNEVLDDQYHDIHGLWIGCGAMCRRSYPALQALQRGGAELTFVDVRDKGSVKQLPPPGADFFDVADPAQREEFHQHLIKHPATHAFVANLPPQHLLTTFLIMGKCPGVKVIIAKPLDVNFQLIEAIASDRVWPGVIENVFLHDHYLGKGIVDPLYRCFPNLIKTYGRVERFEGYLVEHRTIEEENRLDALNEGVICDQSGHLFALVQEFFLSRHHPALTQPNIRILNVQLQINRVARARYANCELENSNAETFAAIEVTIVVHYSRRGSSHTLEPMRIPGLIVVGKGVKPSSSISAGLKGMRFNQQLQFRAVNLAANTVNPPLSDLNYAKNLLIGERMQETGFHVPVMSAMSHRNLRQLVDYERPVRSIMPFPMAAQNTKFLSTALKEASQIQMIFHKAGDTIEQVLGQFVSKKMLSPSCLPESGYGDIGFG